MRLGHGDSPRRAAGSLSPDLQPVTRLHATLCLWPIAPRPIGGPPDGGVSSEGVLCSPVVAQCFGCGAEPGIVLDDAAGLAGCLRVDRQRERPLEIEIALDPQAERQAD